MEDAGFSIAWWFQLIIGFDRSIYLNRYKKGLRASGLGVPMPYIDRSNYIQVEGLPEFRVACGYLAKYRARHVASEHGLADYVVGLRASGLDRVGFTGLR